MLTHQSVRSIVVHQLVTSGKGNWYDMTLKGDLEHTDPVVCMHDACEVKQVPAVESGSRGKLAVAGRKSLVS